MRPIKPFSKLVNKYLQGNSQLTAPVYKWRIQSLLSQGRIYEVQTMLPGPEQNPSPQQSLLLSKICHSNLDRDGCENASRYVLDKDDSNYSSDLKLKAFRLNAESITDLSKLVSLWEEFELYYSREGNVNNIDSLIRFIKTLHLNVLVHQGNDRRILQSVSSFLSKPQMTKLISVNSRKTLLHLISPGNFTIPQDLVTKYSTQPTPSKTCLLILSWAMDKQFHYATSSLKNLPSMKNKEQYKKIAIKLQEIWNQLSQDCQTVLPIFKDNLPVNHETIFNLRYILLNCALYQRNNQLFDDCLILFSNPANLPMSLRTAAKLLHVASSMYKQDSFTRSRPLLERVVDIHENCMSHEELSRSLEYSSILNMLGSSYVGLKNIPQAKLYLSQALKIRKVALEQNEDDESVTHPMCASIMIQLGTCCLHERDIESALKLFDRSIEILESASKQISHEESELASSQVLKQDLAEAYKRRGTALAPANKSQALSDLEHALMLSNSNTIFHGLVMMDIAFVHLELEDKEKAYTFLKRSFALISDLVESSSSNSESVTTDPIYRESLHRYAMGMSALGKSKESIRSFEILLKSFSTEHSDPKLLREVYTQFASVLLADNQSDRAKQIHEIIIKL